MQMTVKAALMRDREQMRKCRYEEEFRTIYKDNQCPVFHHRHMAGHLCRRYRGNVCEKHCLVCRYHDSEFWRCTYREREPMDMREWRLIYSSAEKENLWRGIYRRELIRNDKTIRAGGLKPEDPAWVEAVTRATETVMNRETPKYIIGNAPDENGGYTVTDADTGETTPYIAKYLPRAASWVCVEIMDIGA